MADKRKKKSKAKGDVKAAVVVMVQPDMFGGPDEVTEPVRREIGTDLKDMSRADMVRVSPERYGWVPAPHMDKPSTFCFGQWVPDKSKPGEFRLAPVGGQMVRMTAKVAAELGWRDVDRSCSYDTFKRLGRAGFIRFVQISPGVHLLDLLSWWRHMGECEDNPEFWDKGSEDLKEYKQANGLGGWKR